MKTITDPRIDATRSQALDAGLHILMQKGVLGITHTAISRETGISRSTLYRHWPKLENLRYDVFTRSATIPNWPLQTNGPLKSDLNWIIGRLMSALNDTVWGEAAPQIIAVAATEAQTRRFMSKWIEDRSANVEAVFEQARARGELREDAPVKQLVEMAIAIPYFRKLIEDLPLNAEWLDSHVNMICRLALVDPASSQPHNQTAEGSGIT